MNNDIRNLSKWLNEEQETPIDRQALARVLAMAQQEPVVFYRCKPLTVEEMAKALPRPWPDEGDRVCLSPTELRQFAHGITKCGAQ